MTDKKIYFCEKKKAICITDSCTEGHELQSIPDFDVPVVSRTPSEIDPEWYTGEWIINEPDMDDAGYQMKFKDGTKKTWRGKLNCLEGCD